MMVGLNMEPVSTQNDYSKSTASCLFSTSRLLPKSSAVYDSLNWSYSVETKFSMGRISSDFNFHFHVLQLQVMVAEQILLHKSRMKGKKTMENLNRALWTNFYRRHFPYETRLDRGKINRSTMVLYTVLINPSNIVQGDPCVAWMSRPYHHDFQHVRSRSTLGVKPGSRFYRNHFASSRYL